MIVLADKPIAATLLPYVESWETFGQPGAAFHVAFVLYEGQRYTVWKDDHDTVLVYDQDEWACFTDGVKRGEFDI